MRLSFGAQLLFQAVLISSVSTQFITPLRFQQWFDLPNSASAASNSACAHTLALYEEGAHLLSLAKSTQSLCYSHVDCILDAVGPSVQSKFSSSLVLLGLTPAILAGVGFTIGEIAYLAVHRPGLSLLLSMGSPTVYSGRVMAYSNPEEAWQHAGSSKLVLNGMDPRFGVVISTLQYILAIGSVANIFTLIVDISARSILLFDCVDFYKPILWAVFPILIHLWGTVPYLMGSKRSGNLYASPWLQSDPSTDIHDTQRRPHKKSSSLLNSALPSTPRSIFVMMQRHIVEEMTICACRPPVSLSSRTKVPLWCVFCNSTASLISLVHVIYGTIVLSSVYFIPMEIAIYCIVRFIISAVVCRLILIMEFAGMRENSR